jgi:hypothetical protein
MVHIILPALIGDFDVAIISIGVFSFLASVSVHVKPPQSFDSSKIKFASCYFNRRKMLCPSFAMPLFLCRVVRAYYAIKKDGKNPDSRL